MGRKGNSSTGPVFLRYCRPIRDVLLEKGGSGTASEVTEAVVERLNIPEGALRETLKDGSTSKVYNAVAWARFYLAKAGLLDSSRRGVWAVTEKGRKAKLDDADLAKMFKAVRDMASKGKKTTAPAPETAADPDEESVDPVRDALLARILELSASGFERLCQRLLRESGFEEVVVSGQSGDGGIDGHGVLKVNPFVSFSVLFQCKRYKKSVSSPTIRDFRGAMQGRADKGILLTTGMFTADAKREARRDGAPPVELVDGKGLVAMFSELDLGLKPTTIYEVDESFFEQFEDEG